MEAVGGPDQQLARAGRHGQGGQVGPDQLPGVAGDQAEDLIGVGAGQDGGGDLADRLQAAGPSWASWYSRAFSIATPACPASMTRARSSWSVKASASCFSVRYRLPNTWPRADTGAPRNDRMDGWLGGNPTERGSAAMSRSRSGVASSISTPRMPRPTGMWPMAARCSSVTPVVMNWVMVPSRPRTPRAP
jgi:hypothetical protein